LTTDTQHAVQLHMPRRQVDKKVAENQTANVVQTGVSVGGAVKKEKKVRWTQSGRNE